MRAVTVQTVSPPGKGAREPLPTAAARRTPSSRLSLLTPLWSKNLRL